MRAAVVCACFLAGCSASEPDPAPATPPPDRDPPVAEPPPKSEPQPPPQPFEPELASTKPSTECLVTQTVLGASSFVRYRHYEELRKLSSVSSSSLTFSDAEMTVATFDPSGRLIRRAGATWADEFAYDEHGHVVSIVRTPGAIATTFKNGYDDRGRWVFSELVSSGWGGGASRTDYSYDESDRLVTEAVDNGKDGTVDRRYSHSYDSAGRRVKTLLDGPNFWGDGKQLSAVLFTYDGAGLLIKEEGDGGGMNGGNADGVMEFTQTWTYVGDNVVGRYATDDARGDVVLGPTSWSFDPACGPLIKLFPEIAGMPQ